MAVISTPQMKRIYTLIGPHFRTELQGGIAANKPGYHNSRENLLAQGRSRDYSLQAPADRRGNPEASAGIDITFGSEAELVTMHRRLRKACTPDAAGNYDPRIEGVREFIGTLDGQRVSGYNRYSTGTGSRARVGWVATGYADSSHLWHEHISVFRDWADDDNFCRGLAEVLAGVAKGTFGWRDPDAVAAKPKPVSPPSKVPVVELAALIAAATSPDGTAPEAKDDVLLVEAALAEEGLLKPWYIDGVFGTPTKVSYSVWQRSLGYTGDDANGTPGSASVTALGKKYGFTVKP